MQPFVIFSIIKEYYYIQKQILLVIHSSEDRIDIFSGPLRLQKEMRISTSMNAGFPYPLSQKHHHHHPGRDSCPAFFMINVTNLTQRT